MNCPKCGQAHEPGAVFCGNCGQAFGPQPPGFAYSPQAPAPSAVTVEQVDQPATALSPVQTTPAAVANSVVSPIAQVMNNQLPPQATHSIGSLSMAGATALPAYALPIDGQRVGETKAILSLGFSILSLLITLFFFPLAGLVLAIAGLVLGTLSRSSTKRGVSTAGIILSILGIVFFVGTIAYEANHHTLHGQQASATSTSSGAAVSIVTPCYTVTFPVGMTVNTSGVSCNAKAYIGSSIETSSNAYEVDSATQPSVTAGNFSAIAKTALEHAIKTDSNGLNIDAEKVGTFAGSPAYVVNASSRSGIAAVYVAALHTSTNGNNLFVIAHAVAGSTTDISQLEAQWQWK